MNNKLRINYLFNFFHIIVKSFFAFIVVLFILFTLCVAGYFLDLFINVKTGNYNHPLFGGYVIVSKSMVPTINVNDAILIKREKNNKYGVGDVITFRSTENNFEGYPITHRIIKREEVDGDKITYITKGDNNPIIDPDIVNNTDIYGKVLFVIPKLGYLKSFLAKPSNFLLCVLIPSLIVFVYDFSRILYILRKREYCWFLSFFFFVCEL